jgi:N-acetylmuramoyl-L-alanine amidase
MTRSALALILVAIAAAPGEARGPAPRLRPMVVIDPGHGGSNPGARSVVDGVVEKQITAKVAIQVAVELERRGIGVELTRTRDQTMTLRQRVAIANARGADLFVSVHANASRARTQRGFETYVLTPTGVDVDGRALRAGTGAPRRELAPAVAAVLDDVERGAAQWQAADLAATVQRSLAAVRGGAHDRGVRQDAHHVLLGATMPAVLIEIGFVDHPIEGRELVDPRVQEEIAVAIADAIATQLAAAE